MVNNGFFMNSFIAISLDIYNKKEHILYCIGYADEFLDNRVKNIITEERELGEFVFDFSGNTNEERFNILYDYLSEYERFVEANTQRWNTDDELLKKHGLFTDMCSFVKTPILSDVFFEAQKHLTLNERHTHSSFQVLKSCYPDKITDISNDFRAFYIKDKLYIATDFNFVGLLRFYLDELYAEGMFPRSCMSCGTVFLSGKKHGEVLCSAECRKKKKAQNTMAYYDKLSENEVLFNSLYRKWKQRIDRAEEKQTVDEKGIAQLRQELKEFTEINRARANERKKGNVPEKDGVPDYESFDKLYHDILVSKDEFLYTLFNSVCKKQVK